MKIKEIAAEVAATYIKEHPDCDEEMIYDIIEESISRWDNTKYNNPVSFFNIQIRNTLYQLGLYKSKENKISDNNEAKVPVAIEPVKISESEAVSKSANSSRMSDELRNNIIKDVLNGMPVPEVARKYNLNPSTTRNNVLNWKKKGLLPQDFVPVPAKPARKTRTAVTKENTVSENEIKVVESIKTEKSDDKLTFTTATQNILEFIKQELNNSKLVSVVADEEEKGLYCKYKTSDNEILFLNLKINKEE